MEAPSAVSFPSARTIQAVPCSRQWVALTRDTATHLHCRQPHHIIVMIIAGTTGAPFRFQNLLFATDFSDYSRKALPYLTDLAHRFGSTIYLCHIETPSELVQGDPEADPQRYAAKHETIGRILKELQDSPELMGLTVHTILKFGILAEEINKAIAENQIDLVVIDSHGRTGLRRVLQGSAADVITHSAACPVLTLGPLAGQEKVQFLNILVPVDFSGRGRRILTPVLQLARGYNASISLLHVIPPEHTKIGDVLDQTEAARTELQESFGNEFVGQGPEYLVDFGRPKEAILKAAREQKVDLIAMGIKSERTSEVDLHSGIAYQVMSGAPCPVLTWI